MISVAVPDGVILSEMELERLVDQYGDGLLRTCLLYLRDYGLAEDAVQETFLRAYRSWNRFEGRSSEKTWLTAIAINVCRTMLRSPWRKRVSGEETLALLRSEDPSMPDPTVARAVMRLPKDQRVCIILFYVQEMKIREIAQALEVPQATVSSRLNRARKKLRAELKEWYFDEE
ncbi:MAG: sigma-70 family RNA polymerase sigma factor [Clostridia bacterium]|nr:sigma-70 family RNA polymerase sigma factor [Clostridia bacterium]